MKVFFVRRTIPTIVNHSMRMVWGVIAVPARGAGTSSRVAASDPAPRGKRDPPSSRSSLRNALSLGSIFGPPALGWSFSNGF